MISFAITLLIGFFLSPYIVEHLGAEANGFTQLANNFVTYASLITIALNSMGSRFMSVEYHRGNIQNVKKYYSSLIIANITVILVLILPAFLLIMNLENLLNISKENIFDVKVLFGAVFATYFLNQINSIFMASTYIKNKLYYTNAITAATNLLRAGILVFLFSFFKPHMYYVGAVGVVLCLLKIPVDLSVKKRLIPEIKFHRKDFEFKCVIKLITSGIWNTINQCGNILMTGLDLLLTNLFITPLEMGVLAVAKTMPNHIIQLGNMINNNFSPGLTITYVKSGKDEILKNLRWSMKISSIFMSIPIGVFCMLGAQFYSLWVPSLDCKKLVLLSFLTCMAFVPFSGPQVLYNVYTTTNKLKFNSLTVVAGGFLNFVIVYILLKFTNLGIYAVVGVSSVISIVRNLIITVPYTARLLKLKWYEFYKDVVISCICFVCVVAITFVVNKFIVADNWIMLIVATFVSCILSFVFELLLLLRKSERKRLIEKFLRRSVKNG